MRSLLENYGYWALLIGTFLEGETIMVMAGYFAHQEYLNIYLVMVIGFIGTLCGDQLWYFIGRWYGPKLVQRFPSWKRPTERAFGLLNKYDKYFILSFRFFYGIRNVSPVVIGMARVPIWRYFYLNVIAAIVWAIALGLAGYGFGAVLRQYLRGFGRYELYIFIGLVAVALAIWLVHIGRRLRRARREAAEAAAAEAAARSAIKAEGQG
jgi:membrane protein DedA with SNARE-associated domain